jgi:hypothetical protein
VLENHLDTADIVRDGDFSPTIQVLSGMQWSVDHLSIHSLVDTSTEWGDGGIA